MPTEDKPQDPTAASLKLQTVQQYIGFLEAATALLPETVHHIRLANAGRPSKTVVEELMLATNPRFQSPYPAHSLIDEDLDKLKSEQGSEYLDSRRMLATAHLDLFQRILLLGTRLQKGEGQEQDWAEYLEALTRITLIGVELNKMQLHIARQLQAELVVCLKENAGDVGQAKRRKKAGKKRDPKIAARNLKMMEAWDTKQYSTYAELGQAFKCSAEAARKGVGQARRRNNS
jgi:hypothetical protein